MIQKRQFEDETAGKLIAAGMQLFGEFGFKGTTTRMIASEAHSNIGSIAYYFGNKRNLYLAIIRHIADRMREQFDLDMMKKGQLPEGLTQEEARLALRRIVKDMIRTFIADDEASCWLLLVMREQAHPTEAFDILYEEVFDMVYKFLGSLIAILIDIDERDTRVTLEAHTLVGQIVFFLVGRIPLLRRLENKNGYDAELIDLVEKTILSHIDFYVNNSFQSDTKVE